jgi:hypothetical protein
MLTVRSLALLLTILAGIVRGELKISSEGAVIDGRKIAVGQKLTLAGVRIEAPDRQRFPSRFLIRVLRVDGVATQEELLFYLSKGHDWDWQNEQRKKFKPGTYCKVTGTVRDGVKSDREGLFHLEPESVAACKPIQNSPGDFVGRHAEFEGEARRMKDRATLLVGKESLRIEGLEAWPEWANGKRVMASGDVVSRKNGLMLSKSKWRLLELKDQVGRDVDLPGHFWSLNGEWGFMYRDTKIYVDGVKPETDWHWERVIVHGRLARQVRPSLDQISQKTDRDLEEYFVVRDATVEFPPRTKDPEKKPPVLAYLADRVVDGLPVLADKWRPINLSGNETHVMLRANANAENLKVLVRLDGDRARKTLRRRMNDAAIAMSFRLLYAGVLALWGDAAGPDFVLKTAREKGPSMPDALWIMGHGLWEFSDQKPPKPDWKWAEDFLLQAIGDEAMLAPEVQGVVKEAPMTVREAAFRFGEPEWVLAGSGREPVIDALLAVAMKGYRVDEISRAMAAAEPPVPAEKLLRLARRIPAPDRKEHRSLLEALLKQGDIDAASLFLPSIAEGSFLQEYLDHADADAMALIRVKEPSLTGRARIEARCLLLARGKDPAGALLEWLRDPKCPDRNLVAWVLQRFPDSRVPAAMAGLLRQWCAKELGDEKFENTRLIENSLAAIFKAGGDEAVKELIGLLDFDFSPAHTETDSAGFHRIIAGHLSELMHEGFGTDPKAWRAWWERRKK